MISTKNIKQKKFQHWYNFFFIEDKSTYVTLEHKTSLKSLAYICSNSQQYIVWVKIIDFYLMPNIIRTFKNHVLWRYFVNFLSKIYKNVWLVICMTNNLIWTNLNELF